MKSTGRKSCLRGERRGILVMRNDRGFGRVSVFFWWLSFLVWVADGWSRSRVVIVRLRLNSAVPNFFFISFFIFGSLMAKIPNTFAHFFFFSPPSFGSATSMSMCSLSLSLPPFSFFCCYRVTFSPHLDGAQL
jgi:hypothetical protein